MFKSNKIGDGGAKAIDIALKTNKALKELYLGLNKVGDEGGKIIGLALKANKTLRILDLGENNIQDESGKAIDGALMINKTHLYYNEVGKRGAKVLHNP